MSTDVESRWQRLELDARREQIFECAIRLFGERPFAAVSTTEIAREAGVARGLLNHYFGDKRGLYLEVIRVMVTVPPPEHLSVPDGTLRQRVEAFLNWFLDFVARHGRTWLVAVAGEGLASDPDVQRVLREGDDRAAQALIEVLKIPGAQDSATHATIRAYGGLIKSASREWIIEGSLTRAQVHELLTATLMALVA